MSEIDDSNNSVLIVESQPDRTSLPNRDIDHIHHQSLSPLHADYADCTSTFEMYFLWFPCDRRRRRIQSNSSTGSADVIILDSPIANTTARERRRRRRNRPDHQNEGELVDLTCLPNESVTVDLVDLTLPQQRNPSPVTITTPAGESVVNASSLPNFIEESSQHSNEPAPSILRLKCPVCLESLQGLLTQGKEIRSTVCGHIFCRNCIITTIKSSKKCPTCRKKLTEKQTHPLYLPIG